MGRGLNIADEIDTGAAEHRFPGAAVLERRAGPLQILARIDERRIRGLIDEANRNNHVTVAVYRAVRGPAGTRHKRTLHEQRPVVGMSPSLALADIGRMLKGKKPMYFQEAVRMMGGDLVGAFPNLRTNVGVDYCAAQLSGTTVSVADTVALAASTRSPGATDAATTLPWSTAQTSDTAPVTNPSASAGEITFGGLQRSTCTYAHTVSGPASAVSSYTLAHTWTASTAITSVQLAGLFGGSAKASQGGTNVNNMLFLESTFTVTTLANADQIALTWTVNI
jgi:hypothetical protein